MLKTGKLDSELLKRIVFDNITYRRPEVVKRPGIGEDCAEIDFGEYLCVMSTDPITASVKDIGRLSIHISCNDIASDGIQPLGIMLAVMLPVGTTEEDVEKIMKQASKAAEDCNVEIIGGHTEITDAVVKPVIVSTAVGRQLKKNCLTGIKEGDLIFVTKTCGIEGTGIIAAEKQDRVRTFLTDDEFRKACDMLERVSVVKEGVAAGRIGVSAMHDITEGGIYGAIWEMCHVAGLGAAVEREAIPFDDVTLKICDHFEIDPLRLISSGCMLIIAAEEKREELEREIEEISCIGRIVKKECKIMAGDEEIAPPDSDEIYKVI